MLSVDVRGGDHGGVIVIVIVFDFMNGVAWSYCGGLSLAALGRLAGAVEQSPCICVASDRQRVIANEAPTARVNEAVPTRAQHPLP